MMYKIKTNQAPIYLKNAVQRVKLNRNLRVGRDTDMYEPLNFCKNYRSNILSDFCREWNNLPIEIRNLNSVNLFKTRLKTHYFKLAYDENNGDQMYDN